MNEIEYIYERVLRGELDKFPNKFWAGELGIERAGICTRYMFEKILKWEVQDIPKKMKRHIFNDYKLGAMLRMTFNDSPYRCIESAYPNQFVPWDMKVTSAGWWTDRRYRLQAFVWVVNELNIEYSNIEYVLTRNKVERSKVRGILKYYDGDFEAMMKDLYPVIPKEEA